MAYLKTVWHQLRDSFQFKRSFTFVLAYEVLFVLALAILSSVYVRALGKIGTVFGGFNPSTPLAEATSSAQAFLVNSLLISTVFLAVLFVVYAVLQMCAWSQVLGKRVSGKLLLWFVWANTVWLIPWMAFSWLVIVAMRAEFALAAVIVLSILFIHVSWPYQRALFQHGIRKSVQVAFLAGFGRILHFIVPYFIAAVLLWIWAELWTVVVFWLERADVFVAVPTSFTFVFLSCVVLAPFFAWLKFYLATISSV